MEIAGGGEAVDGGNLSIAGEGAIAWWILSHSLGIDISVRVARELAKAIRATTVEASIGRNQLLFFDSMLSSFDGLSE